MQIAIVGTAKASRYLAPFRDPDWVVWCCGGYDFEVKSYNRWFELHDRTVVLPGAGNGQTGWEMNDDVLAQTGRPVFVQKPRDGFDHEETFPIEKMLELFGERNFTSTPAFMMATAILELRPDLCRTPEPQDTIGIYGVELIEAAHIDHEQRPGMHHFIDTCIMMNIEVVLPAGCGLISRPRVYAYEKETAEEKRHRRFIESTQRRIAKRREVERENFGMIRFEEGVLDTLKVLGGNSG